MAKSVPRVCMWFPLRDACREFANATGGTQSADHIVKLHWYVACRLVIEGGFHPDLIRPHPPLSVQAKSGRNILVFDPAVASGKEATVFGGLKTKNIDVAVTIPEIGPCIAISMKGILNAFRNLTNRLEEAVGDCTNIHIAYPALVYGFLHILRGNREGSIPASASHFLKPDSKTHLMQSSDIAIRSDDRLSDFVQKYHAAMVRLTGRKDLRDDFSRYEAISLLIVEGSDKNLGEVLKNHPDADSPLRLERFFESIYRAYELRFVYGAPDLRSVTRRLEWDSDSPALRGLTGMDFEPRLKAETD